MANVMRWRYGETASVVAAVDRDTIIYLGDLLWLDGNRAKPASALSPGGNAAATRANFAAKFLGVAMQQSPAGDDRPIRVATSGVFEMDTPASTFELGGWVGVAIDSATGRPKNQQVEKVTEATQAIGRIAARSERTTTKVLVAICSTVMAGGVAGTTT
ncbi:MAG: hypothetical protein NZ899_06500 [Thermoguttaceae bacterium]|nr:hypothetical protein [Thermoguttaceae bacterium]MDW8079188.1 hypothetical protein [Thermoguttaceae bacterium]